MPGSVTRTYDTDFRVATESVNGGNSVTFQYDPDSLLTGAGAITLTRHAQHGLLMGTRLGGMTDRYTYSTFGELATYQANYSGSPVLGVTYSRDNLGRITQKTETIGGTTTTTVYGYDPAGRLTDVTQDGTLPRQAAYDLAKLRGKTLVERVRASRRYQAPIPGVQTLAALLILREKVIEPVLAGACQPKPGPTPEPTHPLDVHYANLQQELRRTFETLGLAA